MSVTVRLFLIGIALRARPLPPPPEALAAQVSSLLPSTSCWLHSSMTALKAQANNRPACGFHSMKTNTNICANVNMHTLCIQEQNECGFETVKICIVYIEMYFLYYRNYIHIPTLRYVVQNLKKEIYSRAHKCISVNTNELR